MTGTKLDWQKHCKAEFGEYYEIHQENRLLNSINNEQTQSAIFLGPTTNFQCKYTFLCLTIGERITCKQLRMVPVPATLIGHVEELDTINAQTDENLTFED